MNNSVKFAALVLAADRGRREAVASYANVVCKAYAPLAGQPMIIRVLDALSQCHVVDSVLVCGPPEPLLSACPVLQERIVSGSVNWITNLDSPARSAARACEQMDTQHPILLTTADHALLTSEIVDYFLQTFQHLECDVAVGVMRHETVQNKYGNIRRTVIRLQDGNFCGCNLFAFNLRGRALISFWQQAETLRKQPWKLIGRVLGWRAVWAYLLGRLTLDRALQAVSDKTGVSIKPVILPFPEAGIDVDTVDDLRLVESILSQKGG